MQNDQSKKLLSTIKIKDCTVAGDSRFDRVAEIANSFEPIDVIERFVGNDKCIVAGSTWKEDEEALQKVLVKLDNPNVKLIIAPHEIDSAHIAYLEKLFPTATRFSSIAAVRSTDANNLNASSSSNIVIIDNIGMLSRVYKYAYITYVGGGFSRDGVHNVLEAAVYGKPVVFGHNYKKYKEAIDLVEFNGARTFVDENGLQQVLITLLHDSDGYRRMCLASKKYIEENVGATEKVLSYIEEKRLLTS